MALVTLTLDDPNEAAVVLSALAAFRERQAKAAFVPTTDEVELYKTRRVEAIKAFRARTNMGLAASDEALRKALHDVVVPDCPGPATASAVSYDILPPIDRFRGSDNANGG